MPFRTISRASGPLPCLNFNLIVVQYENLLLRHGATEITRDIFKNEVQLNCVFKVESDQEILVTLCICHTKEYLFSFHHLQRGGAIPNILLYLKTEAEDLLVKLSNKQRKTSGFIKVNIPSEIRTVLEDVNCVDVGIEGEGYSYKFEGYYKSTKFTFKVYHNIDGLIGVKRGKNIVIWEKPKQGLRELKIEEALKRLLAMQKTGNGHSNGRSLTPLLDNDIATTPDSLLSELSSLSLRSTTVD